MAAGIPNSEQRIDICELIPTYFVTSANILALNIQSNPGSAFSINIILLVSSFIFLILGLNNFVLALFLCYKIWRTYLKRNNSCP